MASVSGISEYGDNLHILTEEQKKFLFIENIEREIQNGGFNQFFYNSSGDHAHETIEALKTIGAEHTADILIDAIAEWPDKVVPKDREKRIGLLEEIQENASDTWEKCDERFYEYKDDIGGLLLQYVKNNMDKF